MALHYAQLAPPLANVFFPLPVEVPRDIDLQDAGLRAARCVAKETRHMPEWVQVWRQVPNHALNDAIVLPDKYALELMYPKWMPTNHPKAKFIGNGAVL